MADALAEDAGDCFYICKEPTELETFEARAEPPTTTAITSSGEEVQDPDDVDQTCEKPRKRSKKFGDEKIEDSTSLKKRKSNKTEREMERMKHNRVKYSEKAERSLENFLFGKPSTKKLKKVDQDDEDAGADSVPGNKPVEPVVQDGHDSQGETDVGSSPNEVRKPAWHDEDDDELQVKDVTASYVKAKGKHGFKEVSTENYASSLRRKFNQLHELPKWADWSKAREQDSDDSDDEFFRESTDIFEKGKKTSLEKGFLEFRKLKDMNEESHGEGTVIKAAEFHPSAPVGLVAGVNGRASLFQIDGRTNPKMQSVNFDGFPIESAHFSPSGKQFIVTSGVHKHIFAYDMYSGRTLRSVLNDLDNQGGIRDFRFSPAGDCFAVLGRFGYIHMMSPKSKTKMFSLKMNDDVASVAFSSDGSTLYSHGAGGEVYVWDVRAQECVHKFVDDGCVKGTSLAVSANDRFLACGSNSGVVNVYNRKEAVLQVRPKPEKIVLNLTTTISEVKFNPTSEILVMASKFKENAVKILHLPSLTVFKNFPSQGLNFRRPNCIDFSLNGGFMSIGNNMGAANLFRLKHFGDY